MKPSFFTAHPLDSIAQDGRAEKIARNIMVILKRTGDEFRQLRWTAYKTERIKDGNFTMLEKELFEKVSYLAEGKERDITTFSPVWKQAWQRSVQIEEPEKTKEEN
jgi:hypothetical protein